MRRGRRGACPTVDPMMTGGFRFASGNLAKLLALPKYLLSALLSWFVPRRANLWVFGSGIGVGEGALEVARWLCHEEPATRIVWLVADEEQAEAARREGFEPVLRRGSAGYWTTLRAGVIVVTHGLGDANRFGVFGGLVVQLWHGAPIKRLHLDSAVTTDLRGPAPVRAVLRRMYLAGARSVDLYVAGSPLAAERLRSAFRVDPGLVRVLGDPRDDALARQAADAAEAAAARTRLLAELGRPADTPSRIYLYAPTWRDGQSDPAVPTAAETDAIRERLDALDAILVLRPHPLGGGAYAHLVDDRIQLLDSSAVRDITPLLGGVDLVITDYSSLAIDFSLLGRPIVWFAPDLERYVATRGLYEPLEVTSSGRVERSWGDVLDRVDAIEQDRSTLLSARSATRALAARFHTHPEGGAAERVLEEIRRLRRPARELVDARAIFFESYYGRQVSCNPLAIDREIARRFPGITRYWSVTDERQRVPDGAVALLVGGREWFAARRYARLLVVNDWLRYRFRRARGQTVLQTWHGTMLKHLALGRPGVSLRTRLAILRERRRWSLLLSQNPHSTEQFRRSYAYTGEIMELGYPRDDRLARAMLTGPDRVELNPIAVGAARAALGIDRDARVLAYIPTWRDRGLAPVDELDVHALAAELDGPWVILVRGHTRTHALGNYLSSDRVRDVTHHPDINDVILAADLIVTDYSSVMFDASIAHRPMLFFVPDLAAYRDRERGFTLDFEGEAPGPLLTDRAEVVACARALETDETYAQWVRASETAANAWRAKYALHDDGGAAERVVDALEARGALPIAAGG